MAKNHLRLLFCAFLLLVCVISMSDTTSSIVFSLENQRTELPQPLSLELRSAEEGDQRYSSHQTSSQTPPIRLPSRIPNPNHPKQR